jgi:hypothetical protein
MNGVKDACTSITFGSLITDDSTVIGGSSITGGVTITMVVVADVDAAMDASADMAWAANTSVLMRSQYFSCHTLAKGSMSYLSAIKILASCDILVKEMFDASFMAFIMPDRAFILAASTFSLPSPNFTS